MAYSLCVEEVRLELFSRLRPIDQLGLFFHIFEEGREIESRTVARTPGVQTQFATLTVPSV